MREEQIFPFSSKFNQKCFPSNASQIRSRITFLTYEIFTLEPAYLLIKSTQSDQLDFWMNF